ncbi:MAG TPA: hypothetical protein VK481_08905 [Gemmatimonadaceae bacterium]|jgi:phage/plasmid primase-like uncharacterized protein|nr:hypothetical protein [Gemmatimonadaceae bacterium]
MFKVFIDGNEDRLRLEDQNGEKIGWIHAHTIGFAGVESEKDALAAAAEASRALEVTLRRAYAGETILAPRNSKIELMSDGAYEWIVAGFRPLARLLRPRTQRNDGDSFALEFLVPSYATQHVTLAVAHSIWEVLSKYVAQNHSGGALATAAAGGH